MKKDLTLYQRKYDLYRHHAWAGSILLSVLLAIRVFLQITGFKDIPDIIILPLGVILVIYILVSLGFTYKYRSGLIVEQKIVQKIETPEEAFKKQKISAKIEKERLKLEKKKAKAEVKKIKKSTKK
ncbi:MAG: hypothetical protein DRM98_04240 [Thermoplasmata archaeon]|nr:MAG: hypothetical protein FE039_01730 [Thermoplasmata archaeon]RLF32242.1 MAG: hypothetical protein DRM98_04240 [Thermoplasmata archaeon]RLF36886.1 MAG: hypothetical protein DRM99_01770 [Thermoplasmata archaeon]